VDAGETVPLNLRQHPRGEPSGGGGVLDRKNSPDSGFKNIKQANNRLFLIFTCGFPDSPPCHNAFEVLK
jgi:hypothetical protein